MHVHTHTARLGVQTDTEAYALGSIFPSTKAKSNMLPLSLLWLATAVGVKSIIPNHGFKGRSQLMCINEPRRLDMTLLCTAHLAASEVGGLFDVAAVCSDVRGG